MNARTLLPLFLVSLTLAKAQAQSSDLPPELALQMQEIQELQQKHRYSEALAKIDEMETRYPDNPALLNARGAIYLTPMLRDFAKAAELFEKARQLSPRELPPQFNLAELLFVKQDWVAAYAAFQKILIDFPKVPLQVRHLVLFKVFVCLVKQDKIPEAEKMLAENFTFMDDTPAYFFAKAALAFQKKDEASARDWLLRASGIFKPAESASYLDTLMEVRWVPSIGLPDIEPKSE